MLFNIDDALDKYKRLYNEEFYFTNTSLEFLNYLEKIIDDHNTIILLKESIIINWIGSREFRFELPLINNNEKYCYVYTKVLNKIIMNEGPIESILETMKNVLMRAEAEEIANDVNLNIWKKR